MIGIASKFAALSILRGRLQSSSDPALRSLAQVISNNPRYAHLGALGTSWLDFYQTDAVENEYVETWRIVFDIFGGDGTPENPGLRSVLEDIHTVLSDLEALAEQEPNVFAEIPETVLEIVSLTSTASDLTRDLQSIVNRFSSGDDNPLLRFSVAITESRPAVIKDRGDDQGIGFPGSFWTLREFLSWRRTGKFAARLWQDAEASGDDELVAYALGWISSWSLSACGSSALASICGSPYRNRWWRSRFIANFVDVWLHGYAATGAQPGQTDYSAWPNLCDQELQRRIELPGVAFGPGDMMHSLHDRQPLSASPPDKLVEFWMEAYGAVYGDLAERPSVSAEGLRDAYALSWLVLWFQTSEEALGCHARMPQGLVCEPDWANPDLETVEGPPSPAFDELINPETSECMEILFILAIVSYCLGMAVAGSALLGAMVAEGGNLIEWGRVRCYLSGYRLYLHNAMRALHDALRLAAVVHPYKQELEEDLTASELLTVLRERALDEAGNVPFPFTGTAEDIVQLYLPERLRTGDGVVQSRPVAPRGPLYPAIPSPALPPELAIVPDWLTYPIPEPDPEQSHEDILDQYVERPATMAARSAAYPSGFLDDPANPLGSRSPFDHPGAWPAETGGDGSPVGFSNSLDALVAWLANPNLDLPDWNLDGDRGLGYATWVFKNDDYTNPVQIAQEP